MCDTEATLYNVHSSDARPETHPDNPLWGLNGEALGVYSHVVTCPKCGAMLGTVRVLLDVSTPACGGTPYLAPGEWASSIPCGCSWTPPDGMVLELEEAWRMGPTGTPVALPGVLALFRPPFADEPVGSVVTVPRPDGGHMGIRFGLVYRPHPVPEFQACPPGDLVAHVAAVTEEPRYRWWRWGRG